MFGMSKAAGPAKKTVPKAVRKPSLVSVTVKLEARQRDKLKALGGDAWLREQIDSASVTALAQSEVSPFATSNGKR